MITIRSLFLHFIRAAMGVDEISNISISQKEWVQLYQLCDEQSLLGLCFPLIENMYNTSRPEKKIMLNWYVATERICSRNKKINQTLIELLKELTVHGILALVVKGQISAYEYDKKKNMRTPGDIDIFIKSENWNMLLNLLHSHKIKYSSHSAEKHIEIEYKNIKIEFHHHLIVLSSKLEEKRWEKFERESWEHNRYVEIDGYSVRTLDITDTAVYLLLHMHHHLLTEGIGLRQICDFNLFIKNHSSEINIKYLNDILFQIGYTRAFTAFTAFCTDYLGLDEEYLPIAISKKDHQYAKKLLNTIIEGGNFGKKNNLKGVKPGLLHSMNTAMLVFFHSIKYYHLAPEEAKMYWFRKIFWRRKRIE